MELEPHLIRERGYDWEETTLPELLRFVGELVPIQRVAFRVAVVVIERILSAIHIVDGEGPLGFAAFFGLGLELGGQVEAGFLFSQMPYALFL